MLVALLLMSTFVFGALFERRPYAATAEACRLFTIAAASVWLVGARGGEMPIASMIAAACLVSAVAFWRVAARVRLAAQTTAAAESAVI